MDPPGTTSGLISSPMAVPLVTSGKMPLFNPFGDLETPPEDTPCENGDKFGASFGRSHEREALQVQSTQMTWDDVDLPAECFSYMGLVGFQALTGSVSFLKGRVGSRLMKR